MTEGRKKRIKILETLKENFQCSLSKLSNIKSFIFTQEEVTILRDACIEESQRLQGH